MKRKIDTKMLVVLSLLAAVSYLAVFLIRIPVVAFLKYEPKDAVIVIAGFLYGPLAAMILSVVVSLLEMVTISTTGPIGCLMNILSSCSLCCVAAVIYQKKHTQKGAVLGLAVGSLGMVALMLLWNYLITPFYMEVSREAIQGMLLPVFLPFNLIKAALSSAIALLVYKPLAKALRYTHLLPKSQSPGRQGTVWVALLAVAVLVASIVAIILL